MEPRRGVRSGARRGSSRRSCPRKTPLQLLKARRRRWPHHAGILAEWPFLMRLIPVTSPTSLVGRPRLTGIRRIKHATAAFSSGSVWRAAEHPGDHRDISGLGERETGAGDPGKAEGIALLTSRSRALSTEPSPHGIDTAVSSKPSGIAWLGDIPSSYTRTRLAECVCRHREDTQSAASSPGNSPPPERAQNHRHEFGTRSDDRTMTPQAYSGLQRSYAVQAGDVVIALVGATTGKSVESLALQRLRRKANPSGHA